MQAVLILVINHVVDAVVPQRDKIVVCCLADEAFARVTPVLVEQGLRAERSSEQDARTMTRCADIAAMIYDLDSRNLSVARSVVQRWQTVYPGRPLLLYYRSAAEAVQVVGTLATLCGVMAWPQALNRHDEAETLGRLLRQLLSGTPELLGRAVTSALRPVMPHVLTGFYGALLERLVEGGDGAPGVLEVTARAGVRPWALRRACRAAGLPAPERLIEWTTLIYVISLAAWERFSIARAAARVGLSDKHVRKLRASLLPAIDRLTGPGAADALSCAIIGFAEECGLPSEQAVVLAERMKA